MIIDGKFHTGKILLIKVQVCSNYCSFCFNIGYVCFCSRLVFWKMILHVWVCFVPFCSSPLAFCAASLCASVAVPTAVLSLAEKTLSYSEPLSWGWARTLCDGSWLAETGVLAGLLNIKNARSVSACLCLNNYLFWWVSECMFGKKTCWFVLFSWLNCVNILSRIICLGGVDRRCKKWVCIYDERVYMRQSEHDVHVESSAYTGSL